MSKTNKKAGLAFSDATPQQVVQAQLIIADAAKHRYYVSRIYGMYNAISGKNEPPQTCSSCLRARAKEIQKWYEEGSKGAVQKAAKAGLSAKEKAEAARKLHEAKAAEANKKVTPVIGGEDETEFTTANKGVTEEEVADEVNKNLADGLDPSGLPMPAMGVMRIPLEDGTVIDFTPNEGVEFGNGAKGTVLHPDGAKVKAGTYKTKQKHEVKVQVGSKATYVEVYDDLAS